MHGDCFRVLLWLWIPLFGILPTLAQAQPVSDDEDVPPPKPVKAKVIESDDDQTVTPAVQKPQSRSQQLNDQEIRIGVLEVRPTFEAERNIQKPALDKITQALQQETEAINARSRVIIPHPSVMKYLGPREKAKYEKCWVDPVCLAVALEPANLDYVVVTKLRMVEINPSQITDKEGKLIDVSTSEVSKKKIFAEYSLFVRFIDLRNRKVLKETLESQTDSSKLPEIGPRKYHQMLKDLGLIVERQSPSAEMEHPATVPAGALAPAPASDDKTAGPVEIKQAPSPRASSGNLGMTVAKWTTLGTGAVAAGLGLTFNLLSNKAQSDALAAGSSAQMNDLYSKRRTYKNASISMYVVGGALLTTLVILFIVDGVQSGKGAGSASGVALVPEGLAF